MLDVKKNEISKKILVALSGNLESAVSAFLLKKQGHDVIGIYISYDQNASFLGLAQTDMNRAKAVADSLGITFYVTKVNDLFKYFVLDPYLDKRAYLLSASSHLNYHDFIFNVLFSKAQDLNCDLVSTGHFAKVQFDTHSKESRIFCANDALYDQSSLLASLKQDQINKLVLPLGEILKSDCDKIAKKFLKTPSSNLQNPLDLKQIEEEFLQKRIPKSFYRKVEIKDIDGDEIIGSYESSPNIKIGSSLENYLPQVKKGQKIIIKKDQGDVVLAGDEANVSYKYLEVSNLQISEDLKEEFLLNVEAKIINVKSGVNGILHLKSLSNAMFEANEYLPMVFAQWNIIFYIKQGSIKRLIGRGVISRCLDSLSSNRLAQVALENELEENPNNNLRF